MKRHWVDLKIKGAKRTKEENKIEHIINTTKISHEE